MCLDGDRDANDGGTEHHPGVELIRIYQCFCDRTRLRMLNLLCHGPLCVCHFQELLDEPQVKISKHLAYLKSHGLVQAQREANWMVYSLPKQIRPELQTNLTCLQDCVREDAAFRRDLISLKAIRAEMEKTGPICARKSSHRLLHARDGK